MSDWSVNHSPVRVLGLTLREPLTLAHLILLGELESPLLLGGQCLIGDIALAAFVCAFPAHVSRRKIKSPLAPLAFRVWPRLVKCDPQTEGETLAEWITQQAELPKRWTKGGADGAPLAAPWWINRIAQAMAAGFSYSDATTLPLRLVNLTIAAKLEASGVIEFQTKLQTEFFENVKRWEAERAN